MTALWGALDHSSVDEREKACAAGLEALSCYGSGRRSVVSDGPFTLGIDLVQTLPEDRYDRQPIQFGTRLLVADVRIDNRDELASALGIAASELRELADATLLASAWERWGEAALARLVGDFALIVSDPAKRTLLLARSLGGNRPLFFAQEGSTVRVASMPSGILVDPHFRKGFRVERMAEGLSGLLPDDEDSTIYAGIRRVRPGHVVRLDREGCDSRSFWSPTYQQLRLSTQADYVEAFRSVLDTAVKSRLRTVSPTVGVQLSAGFDSNAVAGTAARLMDRARPLIAFTAAPRRGYCGPTHAGKLADESALASLTAQMHGIEHRIVRHGGPALAHLAAQARLYQDPFRNVVNSGWDADLRESARERGVTMLLTGELGNLTLTAGGAYNLGDLLAQGRWGDWLAGAVASWPGNRLRSILANSFERWIPRKLTGAIERRLHGLPWERELTFVLDAWYSRVTASRPSSPRLPDSYHERFDAIAAFDSGCVRKAALAETGTDVRDPLIDRRVVEFSLSLPPEQLFAGGVASPLARMALRDRVPPDLLRKRIRGHQSADWHERFLPADAQRLAAEISESPVARELIDFEKVQKAIDRWPTTNLAGNATSLRYVHFLPMTFAAGLLMIEMDCEGWPELSLGR